MEKKSFITTMQFLGVIFLCTPTAAFLPTRTFSHVCHTHHSQDDLRHHRAFCKSNYSLQKSYPYAEISESENCDSLKSATTEQVDVTQQEADKAEDTKDVLTNAVIRVSFDGRMFTGWSGANDSSYDNDVRQDSLPMNDPEPKTRRKRRRRRGSL
mmetsp:Transcript_3903/g.8976  ORF Transcript_3903/g.8976 Transcript_3903/m.8976 type:complete len:155 (+) Transcript_3903:85-549(+)